MNADGAAADFPIRPSTSGSWKLLTADVRGLPAAVVDDAGALRRLVERALGRANLSWVEHRFVPRGASFVGTGADIRLVAHTWPERGALTIDLSSPHPEAARTLERCVDGVLAAARAAAAL